MHLNGSFLGVSMMAAVMTAMQVTAIMMMLMLRQMMCVITRAVLFLPVVP